MVAIVGSGITVGGDGAAPALFHHAAVVGAALVALILTFADVSGAHFNPVVTLADAAVRRTSTGARSRRLRGRAGGRGGGGVP